MDDNAPATKGDLARLETSLEARLDKKLDEKLERMEARLGTKLSWELAHMANTIAESNAALVRSPDDRYRDLPGRVDRLEQRVDRLEQDEWAQSRGASSSRVSSK